MDAWLAIAYTAIALRRAVKVKKTTTSATAEEETNDKHNRYSLEKPSE